MEKIIIEILIEENSSFNVDKAIEEIWNNSKEMLKIDEGNLSVLTKHGRTNY